MCDKGNHVKAALFCQSHNSPATAYLVSVLEKRVKDDTFSSIEHAIDRVKSAFASLSEIAPHCGVYSPILKLVQEELMSGVYSDMFTTTKVSHSEHEDELSASDLERVPYFVLLKRLQEQQNANAEVLTNEIEDMKRKLEQSDQAVVTKNNVMKHLQAQLSKVDTELAETKRLLDLRVQELEMLNESLSEVERSSQEKQGQMLDELSLAAGKKQQLQNENHGLRPYKMSYNILKDTFDLPPDKRPRRGFRRPILATKKTQLLSSIEAASKLEQQIFEVQNKILEEYDRYLEDVKDKLSTKRFSDSSNDPNYYNEELQLESMGDEIALRQQNFQRLVSGIVVELELVRSHREALQNELSQLEQAEMGARAVADGDGSTGGTLPPSSSLAGGRPGSSRMMLLDDGKKNGRDSRLSFGESGLEEDNSKLTDPSSDPFNPQEWVLSKYSAMIYTSVNGGKSFDEISSATFCISCGEKTALCPHKVTKDDMIIRLPRKCTHVKVSRPQVRIALSVSQQGVLQTASTLHPGRAGADTWLSSRPEPHGWDASGDWVIEDETRRQLASLWDDFKSRTGMEKGALMPVARELSYSRVLSLIEQLYASVSWQDDHPPPSDDGEDIGTMKDYFYNFISERYQEDEIMPLATFDFLVGVIKHAAHDKMILVFGQVLAGNLDGSVARYVLLIADLIEMVQWRDVKDFETLAAALYPFMHEEDIDQFAVEYTAFSENKISKTLLMDYFIHIILKNKEPRIQDVTGKLMSVQVSKPETMSMAEFIKAMESVAPLANERLWRRLMKETFSVHKEGYAPISHLSCIAAYVSLVQVTVLLKEHLVEKIERGRGSRKGDADSKLDSRSQLVAETGRLLTMAEVKKLAFNTSRQRRAADRPMESDNFWLQRPDTQNS